MSGVEQMEQWLGDAFQEELTSLPIPIRGIPHPLTITFEGCAPINIVPYADISFEYLLSKREIRRCRLAGIRRKKRIVAKHIWRLSSAHGLQYTASGYEKIRELISRLLTI